MKKFLALILALVCLSVLCIPALAAPSGVNSMAIVGENIPGVDAWKPESPSGDMDEVETNIYVKEIVVTEAVTMTIKFAGNDTWDNSCNFGSGTLTIDGDATELVCDGGSTNMTLEVTEPCTLVFTLDLNDFANGGAATVKVEKTESTGETPETPENPENPDEPAEQTVTIHAHVPTDWTAPNFWAWEAATQKNAFAGWPGEPMTQDGEWFTIEVPAWVDSIIVNCNGSQTADLTVEAGKEAWVVVAADITATVTYEEPVLAPEEPAPTEPEATEPEETNPAAPTEETKSAEELEAERNAKRTKAIITIVCVVAGIVAVAVIMSLVPKKFA